MLNSIFFFNVKCKIQFLKQKIPHYEQKACIARNSGINYNSEF